MPGSFQTGGMTSGMLGGTNVCLLPTIIGSLTETPILTPILTTGDNVIAVPTGATAFAFTPATGLAGVKYRVVAGDTGVYISPLNPTVIAFDAANTPASFYLNVGTAASSASEIRFI